MDHCRTQRIRDLNDTARHSFQDCRVLVTKGLQDLPNLPTILDQVRQYRDFTPTNDPFGEHDFGSFQLNGLTIFWKFDYYDLDLTMSSLDPSDRTITARVLTIMLAEEY